MRSTVARIDSWTEKEDKTLALVILEYIKAGKPQLAAFEDAGKRLGRTAAACGFRWNSGLRKDYAKQIEEAKEHRNTLRYRKRSKEKSTEQEPHKENYPHILDYLKAEKERLYEKEKGLEKERAQYLNSAYAIEPSLEILRTTRDRIEQLLSAYEGEGK